MHERILQGVVELLDIELEAFAVGKREIMNPVFTAIAMTHPIRELAKHTQAEVFENRQHV